MPVDVTLTKEKYRRPGKLMHRTAIDPPEGTWTYNAGKFSRKTSNSGKAVKSKQGTGPRRRAYNTHNAR